MLKLPKDIGMEHENKLLLRENSVRQLKLPNEAGMHPWKLLAYKERLLRDFK